MKKLLILLVGFLGLYSVTNAQVPIGAPKTPVRVRGAISVDSVINLPKQRPTLNIDTGSIYYNKADSSFYKWTGSQWLKASGVTEEADPTVPSVAKGLTSLDSLKWNVAYDKIISNFQYDSASKILTIYLQDGSSFQDTLQSKRFVDSVRKKSGTDSVFFYINGSGRFAYKDSFNTASGEVNTASNQGSGAQLFKTKSGVDLQFRTVLSANANTIIQQNTNDVTLTTKSFIDSVKRHSDSVYYYLNGSGVFAFKDSVGTGEQTKAANSGTGATVFKTKNSDTLYFKSFIADYGLTVANNTNDVTFKADSTKLSTLNALRDTAAAVRLAGTETVSNVGSAYRLVKPRTTLNDYPIKTIAAGFAVLIDTLVANQIRITTDTASLPRDTATQGYAMVLTQVGANTTYAVDANAVDKIDYYIANAGSNTNAGTSEALPKQTIDGVESSMSSFATTVGKSRLGLRAGDIFREQYDATNYNRLGTYNMNRYGANQFARISGADVQTGWTATSGQANVWEKNVTHTIPTTNPGYHYLGLILIDTLLEKTNPLGARIHLPLASSLSNANSTDGSYYTDGLNSATETVYINPPDNVDPDLGRYRVEVTVRPFAIDATNGSAITTSSYDKLLIEHLWLQDAGHGYGLVGAGDSLLIRNSIFEGGITHNVVFASGTIEKTLFIPGAKGIANQHSSAIMYKPDGTGGYGRLYGNIFLNTYQGFLAHTSSSSVPHERVDIFGNYAFADTSYTGPAFAIGDARRVIVKNNFTDGFNKFFEGTVQEGIFENNKFINCRDWASGPIASNPVATFYFTNNLIKTFGNSASTQPAVGFYYPQSNTTVHFRNNIFHLKTDWSGISEPVLALAGSANQTRSKKNVFIVDVPAGTYAKIISVDDDALGNFVSDSNVFIIVGAGGIIWTVTHYDMVGPNKLTLEEWQDETGMDMNSIVINVTSLNEIYIDPQSGNYNFASTAKADSVKLWLAGMTSPPAFFPRKPTYDEAAQYVMNDGGKDSDAWIYGLGTAPGTAGSGETNTASNVGSGIGLYKEKSGVDLRFKSLTDDNTVILTSNTNDVSVKVDTTTIATKWYAQSLVSASGWGLNGNSNAGTEEFGTTSNTSIQFISNNTNRMALTAGGKFTVGIALGTEDANYGTQFGTNFRLSGTTAYNIGFGQTQTVTAQANSGPTYGRYAEITFNDNSFTGVAHNLDYLTTSLSTVAAVSYNNTGTGEIEANYSGFTNTIKVNTGYGIYSTADALHFHAANSTSITFNVGFFDTKFTVSETGVTAVGLGTFGSLTTGNPAGGTAGVWKLGSLVTTTGLTLSTTQYIQVDIGGTLYKLALVDLP